MTEYTFDGPDDFRAFVAALIETLSELRFHESSNSIAAALQHTKPDSFDWIARIANECSIALANDGSRLPPCAKKDLLVCVKLAQQGVKW